MNKFTIEIKNLNGSWIRYSWRHSEYLANKICKEDKGRYPDRQYRIRNSKGLIINKL